MLRAAEITGGCDLRRPFAELGPLLGDSVTYIGGRSAIITQRAFKVELRTSVYLF